MNKAQVFEYELSFIKNSTIKHFAIKAIESLPDYFFSVAASSTGKYHPSYALGEGGLVRHTKSAVRIALELFRNNTVQSYTDDQKDIIVVALLLHDGAKHGLGHSKYTVAEHPNVIVDMLKSNNELNSILDKNTFKLILDGIATHMGEWNKDFRTKVEILEKPSTGMQKFIHMCDYLASRKCLEFNFDVEISK